MDIEQIMDYEQQLDELIQEQRKALDDYAKFRVGCAESKARIDLEVAKHYAKYASIRKSIGYESAILMRLQESNGDSFAVDYNTMLYSEANYKAFEKRLDCLHDQIMAVMSIMKYKSHGDAYGS